MATQWMKCRYCLGKGQDPAGAAEPGAGQHKLCPACGGRGSLEAFPTCATCAGSGRTARLGVVAPCEACGGGGGANLKARRRVKVGAVVSLVASTLAVILRFW